MTGRRAVNLLAAFLRASRQRGLREATRRGVRRTRNRLVRPILEEQAASRNVLNDLLARLASLEQHSETLDRRHAALEQRNAAVEIRNAALEQSHAALEQRNATVEQRNAAVEIRNAALEQSHAALDLRNATLEQSHAALTRGHAAFEQASRSVLRGHSESIFWLVENSPSATAAAMISPAAAASPLVSVIMAARDREGLIADAIESILAQTYTRWELLVVDDGSTDGTAEVVGRYRDDPRVRYQYQDHSGAAAARNRALAESRGEIIAYLDTDNTWYPGAMAAVVQAFAEDPSCESAYFAQLWRDQVGGSTFVRSVPFDHDEMKEMRTPIDLNAFAHRRRVFERAGGFDPELTRLLDWDLILRYTADRAPRQLQVIGGRYENRDIGRISTREDFHRNRYLVRRKYHRPVESPPRVLYALWHYPQLSESYVATEIACMRRWGVDVEVWSECMPASPFSTSVPIHRGTLAETLDRVRPDIVHVHWLNMASKFRDDLERAGVPATVRGHGFEFSPDLAAALQQDSLIRALYIFPHMAATCPPGLGKVRPMNSCFNPDLYRPGAGKDRRLVLRTGSGLPTKDIPAFMRIARECPDHRFVLTLARCNGIEEFVDVLIEENRALGEPVDLRVNVPPEEMALLMQEAGIYLHTHSPGSKFGMPASIGEAMATGAYVIGRRCLGSEAYIGDAGDLYDDEDQAARLVRMTTEWSGEQWRRAEVRSIDRAYGQFLDSDVLRPILEDWVRLAAESTSPASLRASA